MIRVSSYGSFRPSDVSCINGFGHCVPAFIGAIAQSRRISGLSTAIYHGVDGHGCVVEVGVPSMRPMTIAGAWRCSAHADDDNTLRSMLAHGNSDVAANASRTGYDHESNEAQTANTRHQRVETRHATRAP